MTAQDHQETPTAPDPRAAELAEQLAGTGVYDYSVPLAEWSAEYRPYMVAQTDTILRYLALLEAAPRAATEPTVSELRAALIDLRHFSETHHGDQDKAMLLHALLVDIPHRLDALIDARAGDKAEAPPTLVCERNESVASAHGHTADCYR